MGINNRYVLYDAFSQLQIHYLLALNIVAKTVSCLKHAFQSENLKKI